MTFDTENFEQDKQIWTAKSGKSYFCRMRWENATLYLRQTLRNLRPGSYSLSFSAATHIGDGASGSLSVSVAGKKADVTVASNENGNWSDYTIDFDIAEGTKYATIEIKGERSKDLFKFGIDEFKLTYDGSSYYETILNKAQALYNNNKDWAKEADALNTAITEASGKTEINDKNNAIFALETAMQTFKDANTIDITSKINNPNFDSNISGWTCTGGDGNNFQRQTSSQANFNGGFLERWRDAGNGINNQKNFDISQQLTNLPKGEYTIKAAVIAVEQGTAETFNANSTYTNKKHGGPYYIDDEHGVWLYGTSGENSSMAWANTENSGFTDNGTGEYKSTTIDVQDGTLTIGLKGIGSPNGGAELGTYANWIACDNWTVSYFGFDASTLLSNLSSLKEDATTLLADDDYNNVTGTERSTLQTAKEVSPEETKSELDNAIAALEKAIADFKAAKDSYDSWEATWESEKSVAEKLGISKEEPTTAAEAATAGQRLNVAEYNATIADYTTAIELGDWTTSGAATFNNEHWSGKTSGYLNQDDSNGKGWGSNNWTMTCNQEITLPAGEYVFKAAGRKSANASLVLSVKNGETNIGEVSNFPSGNRGLGISTDGKASFDNTTDAFAASNAGYGWQWRFLPFTLEEETTVTIAIEAGSTEIHNWASFGDYTVMAKPSTAASEIAYGQAVDAARAAMEANTIVTGDELTALNEAIAVDKGTTTESIDAAIANIKSCTEALIAAAPKYQALLDAKALEQDELTYASEDKYTAFTNAKNAEPSSAADAEAKANAIIAARRAYIESNGKAEGVEGAKDYTENLIVTTAGDAMPNVSYAELRINSGQGPTESDGNTVKNYFDTSGTFYGSNNLSARLSQEVSDLPTGKYLVTVQARGGNNLQSLVLTAGAKNLDLGVQNPTNAFENGWDAYSLETAVDNTGKLAIKIEGKTNSKNSWFSFNDFRLVRIGDLDAVTLDEATANTIEAKAADVTLKRTLTTNWNTIILPFVLTEEQISDKFGEGTQVAAFKNASTDEATGTITLNFETATEMAANVPYLIKPANAGVSYTFDGVTLVAADDLTAGEGDYKFVGNYNSGKQLSEGDFFIDASENKFYRATGTETMKAFRATFVAPATSEAKVMNFTVNGGTITGIDNIDAANSAEAFDIYSINGVLIKKNATSLSGLAKGVYIVNGKKYIAE